MTKEFLKECPGAMVKGVEGSSIGKDCLLLLQGKDGGSISRAKMQKQKWESDILQCYCGSREGLDGNILLRCSRCKVVSYCSPEHQKADWKNHKPRCIKPSWE
ncbi:hypothetical protein C8J56DRAFT_773001 [Mycena floridula]|nr:hypothetical protein C8J56DRAFT_773001 [Mycena floridula]